MPAAWQNLSLRLRLTLLYVGLLTVLLVALGSILYFDTQNVLIAGTVLRLQTQALPPTERAFRPIGPRPAGQNSGGATSQGFGGSSPNLGEIANFLARSQTTPDTTAAIFGGDGNLLADGRTLPEQPLSAPPNNSLIGRALSGQEGLYYSTNVSGQHTLVLLIPLRVSGPAATISGVLQLSTRLDLVDEVLGRQQLLIIVGVLITLVLGTVGGLWLTGSGLAPLRLMIVTSKRIAGGDLRQRVNLPHRHDEIGQLAASFDEMVGRLEEAFALQRQFIADASHELRTPLTALAGSLDVLLLAPEDDPEVSRRMLTGMRRELARLTRLVADLLTLNRLDAHQGLHLQAVDLAALAREVAEQIKPLAGERGMEIEVEGDTHVQGDADRLKQVLLNLLDNAIRYTDAEKGAIRVQIRQVGENVRLTVSDNGGGIPPEAHPHLFERFFRVDKARARDSFGGRESSKPGPAGRRGAGAGSGGGSGLGLAIVKAIVDAHHGTIAPVKSDSGQGSRFELTIPRGSV
jgi:two-component system, OmpR family, sensor kinase